MSKINGTNGNDTLNGTNQADVINGLAGNDTLNGKDGDDILTGGTGNDTFKGGNGFDTVQEFGNVNFVVTNTGLTGLGSDSLNSIEQVDLTGGSGDNLLNASGFSGVAILDGGTGNDTLIGSNDSSVLTGGAGNDTIIGGAGTDFLIESGNVNFVLTNTSLTGLGTDTLSSIEFASLTGGSGNNVLNALAFSGNVTLSGGAGNDTLLGSSNSNSFTGGAGNDRISGGASNLDQLSESGNVNFVLTNTSLTGLGTDTLSSIESAILTGGSGNNVLDASAFSGQVRLTGGDGNDTITGGSGDDKDFFSLSGGAGNDILNGGAGNDNLSGEDGNDILNGGVGDDNFFIGDGNDRINGGDGSDLIEASLSQESGNVNFVLTDAKLTGVNIDSLRSIERADLRGSSGDNVLDASAFTGKVNLSGNEGNDTLLGGSNNDVLSGDGSISNGGNDFLDGGAGNDILSGDTGNDTLIGGLGNDTLIGGLGNDTYSILTGDAGDTIIEDANPGIDLVESEISFTLAANVENLTLLGSSDINGTGNELNNKITGNNANNTLDGGAGNDFLNGGSGSDILLGGNDNDVLVGGLGGDRLTGGLGANHFRYNAANELNNSQQDFIADFAIGVDSIEVKASGFDGGLKAGTLSADQLKLSVLVSQNT